ncbi:MAG: hypothetical protein HY290_17520 [Planctomycetia bacterium]|nr:hypothetical protein [Planctomycetia bacterium]
MRIQTQKLALRIIRFTARQIMRWLTATLIGAVGGAVYGLLYGGLGMLLQSNPAGVLSVVLYFSACGVAAGAMLGAFVAIADADTDALAVRDGLPQMTCDSTVSPYPRLPGHTVEPRGRTVNRLVNLFARHNRHATGKPSRN